jgi:hypothetical protein
VIPPESTATPFGNNLKGVVTDIIGNSSFTVHFINNGYIGEFNFFG